MNDNINDIVFEDLINFPIEKLFKFREYNIKLSEYFDVVQLRAHVESQVDLQIEEVFLDTVDQHAHVDAMQIQ